MSHRVLHHLSLDISYANVDTLNLYSVTKYYSRFKYHVKIDIGSGITPDTMKNIITHIIANLITMQHDANAQHRGSEKTFFF